MINFSSVTLNGFKSFVDKTELEISPGLTGIVGPNGCGKSNLVEALRWAMGENSAKRMRGGDMDDVIFNGTSSRPARNFAEVVIKLANLEHDAPEPYAPFDEIEVSRRIEREEGSTYRVNGKIARARDVQLLFADTMSGAHSPALVSQGKLTAIISAKPMDRRTILEDSAGISGLHARRHEAELRLQAAENNLQRLQDVVGGLESQLSALKRQGRQAEKYRVLSEEIKTLETTIAALEWVKLIQQQQINQHEATTAEGVVAEALLTVTQLTQSVENQSLDLPKLRTQAAEAAARYQAVTIELRQLENEETLLTGQIAEMTQTIGQIVHDIAHDQQAIEDGKSLLTTLDQEEKQLVDEQQQQEGRLPTLEANRDSLERRLNDEEKTLQEYVGRLVEIQAKRQALTQQATTEETRLRSTAERYAKTTLELKSVQAKQGIGGNAEELDATTKTLEQTLNDLQAKAVVYQENMAKAEQALEHARDSHQNAQTTLTKLTVEKNTLETFLASDLASGSHPILEDVRAESGFEQALAQALGDTLFGSMQEDANIVWRTTEGEQRVVMNLPLGVASLKDKVQAPEPVAYALSFIGYVDNRAAGDAAAKFLKPGQSIVSLDGYLWRWDGVFIKPSTKDRQAQILEQKNRLEALAKELPTQENKTKEAEATFAAAQNTVALTRQQQAGHTEDVRMVQEKLNAARQQLQESLQEQQKIAADQARLSETLRLLQQDAAERQQNLSRARADLKALEESNTENLEEKVAALKGKVTETQGELRTASLSVDRYLQEEARRKARLHGIADQRIALNNRSVRATEHLAQLNDRLTQSQGKLEQLQSKPAELETVRMALMTQASTLEQDKAGADDALQRVENEVATTSRALKEAEYALSTFKENRAALLARLEALNERITSLEAEIVSQFGQTPVALMESVQISTSTPAEALPDLDQAKARKEKITRDREAIGPVNLRADVEAQEIGSQLDKILAERDDLLAAIEELRAGIAKINTEARERLLSAFETINTHFKDLFARLFGGGQAHLALVESDDPLGAGLEIFAQPPGKSLQSISLLSGGEQSLTAAALIFAMFLTNPSPICILDEIDAPLDDANVDRICTLLRDITELSKTRFLIVTHHRLTMARMDRLYGVTMGEKGVSQLVSVDLDRQLDFLEAAE